jgi:hypothetical protein
VLARYFDKELADGKHPRPSAAEFGEGLPDRLRAPGGSHSRLAQVACALK